MGACDELAAAGRRKIADVVVNRDDSGLLVVRDNREGEIGESEDRTAHDAALRILVKF